MDTLDKLYIIPPYNLDGPITNSHKHLARALYSLVSTQPFDTITVKEICDEAAVSRSNFYNHFDDKYHLLLFCLKLIPQVDLQNKLDFNHSHMLFDDFLVYIVNHQAFFRSLVSFENGSELRRLLESVINGDIREFLQTKAAINQETPVTPLESRVSFLTGGVSSLIQWWLLNGLELTVQEISQTINEFVTS